jgi:hypothetical protein
MSTACKPVLAEPVGAHGPDEAPAFEGELTAGRRPSRIAGVAQEERRVTSVRVGDPEITSRHEGNARPVRTPGGRVSDPEDLVGADVDSREGEDD